MNPPDAEGRSEGFAERVWREVTPWYDAIRRHPFLTGLTAGTLPPEVFARYLLDDAHYLRDYARALATLAARADAARRPPASCRRSGRCIGSIARPAG